MNEQYFLLQRENQVSMIVRSVNLFGFKYFLLAWVILSTGTFAVQSTQPANEEQSTPSPSEAWHELQDSNVEEKKDDIPEYFWDLGEYLWSWVKDHPSIPKDHNVFVANTMHFNAIDTNGDSKLDGLELLQYMHHNGMVHQDHHHNRVDHDDKLTHFERDASFIDSLLRDVDADNDGYLDFYEYQKAASKYDHSKHPVMEQKRVNQY